MVNVADVKKTYYYLKKNGMRNTFYAVCERMREKSASRYCFTPITLKERDIQLHKQFDEKITFSILVPMYETPKQFAEEMIQSVLAQTYGEFELILADASESDSVERIVRSFSDCRIRYFRLNKNDGISENTNQALAAAGGEYIGLLDHDDLLTENALYEMAKQIENGKQNDRTYAFLYSDEDKCDTEAKNYYDPNIKPEFNYDLLLSNNYICHFLVMKKELMQQLGFRKEYDGAQDYDLILRAVHHKSASEIIGHIPMVLYHWRCHESSTASNPQSKQYAYEAGKKVIEDFLKSEGIGAIVTDTKHNGFYRIEYLKPGERWEDIFHYRPDVGILAGPIYTKNKITGGIYCKDGSCPYRGLNRHFSGYLHRAALQQNGNIIDIHNMLVNPAIAAEITEILEKLNDDLTLNKAVSNLAIDKGYRILWDPRFQKRQTDQGGK